MHLCVSHFTIDSSEFSTWFECLCSKSDFPSTRGLSHVKDFYINTLCKMRSHFLFYFTLNQQFSNRDMAMSGDTLGCCRLG